MSWWGGIGDDDIAPVLKYPLDSCPFASVLAKCKGSLGLVNLVQV